MILFIFLTSALYLLRIIIVSFISYLLITYTYRFVRSQIRGSRYIRKPDENKYTRALRPIYVGAELIVGYEDEVKDGKIIRYSISPEITAEAVGTIVRVDSITMNHYEISIL